MDEIEPLTRPTQSESERLAFLARRRGRNLAMLVVLGGLMALFYLVTIAKIGLQ